MALVFMDSFDHYATNDLSKKWDQQVGYVWGSNSIGYVLQRRPGSKYLHCNDKGVRKDVLDTADYESEILTFVMGAACYHTHNCYLKAMNTDAGTMVRLYADNTGILYFYIGSTLIEQTPTDYIDRATWFHLEMKVVIHPSAGSYEVRLNEVVVLSGSGLDTEAVSGRGVGKIEIGGGQYGQGIGAFDDFFFLDGNASDDPANPNNDFLGDCRIDVIYPNAAGDYTDFTPYPAAPNYDNVDDPDIIPMGGDIDEDETYNESPTVGHKDIYNLDSVNALGTPIFAAAQNSCMRKTDAGRRYVKQLVKINGTDYLRTTGLQDNDGEWRLTDNYKVLQRPLDVNPDTDLAWTESDLDGTQSGVQITV